MKRIKVLVTAVGSSTAISVIKSFHMQHEYDVDIYGTDTNQGDRISGSAFCDHFFPVPPASDEPAYIEAILGLIEENAIDLFIPIVDEELEIVAKYGDIIKGKTLILLSPYETIRTCNDKYLTYRAMQEHGIAAAKTILLKEPSETSSLIEENGLSFPLIAKPRRGRGSQDVYRLDCPDDLVLLNRIEDPVIQEYLTGQEYAVVMFCTGDRMAAALTRKTIALKGGVTYQCELVEEPELIKNSEKIARSMRFLGPVHTQWFFSDSQPVLLEINPRFNGATCFESICGYNYPLCALRMADRGDPGIQGELRPFRMCRYWSEVYYPLDQ